MLRPLSSGRFRALSFDSVFFLAVQKENEWKVGIGGPAAGHGIIIKQRNLVYLKNNIFSEIFVYLTN